jgi:hypothetical protein
MYIYARFIDYVKKEMIMKKKEYDSLDAKTADILARYLQNIVDDLRNIVETRKPDSAKQDTSNLRAKEVRSGAWFALRLEADGLDAEEALILTMQQKGLPEWVLRAAIETHRVAYLTHHKGERNKKILKMAEDGYNNTDIGLRMNLHRSTVSRIRNKKPWTRPVRGPNKE